MQWNSAPEYIACVLLLILLFFSRRSETFHAGRTFVFRMSIVLALITTMLDIATTFTITDTTLVPQWMNALLDYAGYAITPLVGASILFYLSLLIHASSVIQRSQRRVLATMGALYVLYLGLLFSTSATHLVFSFGSNGEYVRGRFYQSPGMLVVLYFGIFLAYVFLERNRIKRPVALALAFIFPIGIIGIAIQIIFPELLLSGTVMALVLLVLFITFQNHQVYTDSLTGLGDREAFFDALMHHSARGDSFHVVMIGLRKFRRINRRYGQYFGDELLREIARTVRSLGRDLNMSVFRNAGSDFSVIILDDGTMEDSYNAYLARILERFKEPWTISGVPCTIMASLADIDYPCSDGNGTDILSALEYKPFMVRDEETAEPVDAIVIPELAHFSDIRAAFARREHVIELMQDALAEDRFAVVFQPLYSCGTDRYAVAELLIRLNDTDGTPVSPEEFIPIAEQSDLIVQIGWYTIEKACQFFAEHPDSMLDSLSVNLSTHQLIDDDMTLRAKALVDEYAIDTSRIKFEITERTLASEPTRVYEEMHALHTLGFGFHLDDFGTDYSNLTRVMRMPFETIKIDRSLIWGAKESEGMGHLLKSLTSSFQRIGMEVVAEGVETAEHDELVKACGVDKIQGFLYARPMSSPALVEFLAAQAG